MKKRKEEMERKGVRKDIEIAEWGMRIAEWWKMEWMMDDGWWRADF
jgi:hypothetical protein